MTTREVFLNVLALCLIATLAPSPTTEAARILGFFPTPSKSHLIVHCAIADALAEAGHNVTVISTWPNANRRAKYDYIHIDTPGFDENFAREMVNNPQPFYKRFAAMLQHNLKISNDSLAHPTMQKFMHEHSSSSSDASIDLVIVGYFINDFHLGLGAYFKCPVVVSFMIQPIFMINALIGNPLEMSYVPALMSGTKQPLQFFDRVKNFMATFLEKYGLGTLNRYHQQKFYDHHFPSDRYPPFDEVIKNVSLVLTNHHFNSQGPIRPNVPGLIEIGGIQVKDKPDPLPSDIAQVLDSAKNGVIYFSLGSIVEGSLLSKEKAKIMFDVLSKLPYTVLWRWGASEYPGIASNIVYKDWLPQDDILTHPNVKLFITHGGQGSVVESQYHGVPMVGIPLFGDQPANMANVERQGFGLSLQYASLTEQSLSSAIVEVLENPKYRQAVQEFSRLYRDRPMTPRQMTVFWVEYVLRHKGAKHLQSPAVYMNDWQLMSLDVIGFLLFTVFTVFGVLVLACKFLCCRGKKHRGERGGANQQSLSKSKKYK